MSKEKLIVIDGNSLMHRAFYAVPPLTNSKGLHTNVIFGFINMLNKVIDSHKPQYIGIAFDRKAPTFRHLEYAEYKAGRRKMPEEMAEQIPVLKEAIAAMNIKQVEMDSFEADDIIGTIAKQCDDIGLDALIVTGDRDALQLISDNVHVMITKKGISEMEEFDTAKLAEVYSLTPAQVVDLKGLMGDASDNIPGVPGVGEKTATELIKEYGTVENVLDNIPNIKKNKLRENLENNREQALFSKKLATIVTDVPISFALEDYKLQEPDIGKLCGIYKELEFKSLLDKLGKKADISFESKVLEDVKANNLSSEAELQELVKAAQESGIISFKLDSAGNLLTGRIYIADSNKQYSIDINEANLKYISELMENESVKKIGHDAKHDIVGLRAHGITVTNLVFDTMIASYLLNPSRTSYKISEVYREYLGLEIPDYGAKGEATDRALALSVKAIYDLKELLDDKLAETEMAELYYKVELPLVEILADMELEGFKVDKSMLEVLSADFAGQIENLTDSIYLLAGESFNINSTKQLGTVLFEKLGLPALKKTKTGYSTDVEVLEELADKHPIIENILEYRQLVKLKSTYVDGLIGLINERTGKIHSKLNQAVTATGRLSSTDPNLQNIPVKTDNGRQLRKVFVAKDSEHVLVDADYSQIELRILAHISGDENLIDAFIKEEDIHTRTASEVFGVPKGQVTPVMRGRAKAVNFGIVYGISDFGLSRDLKITKKEAKKYIDNYFARYPKVKKYMDDIVEMAKSKGYVTTILNRRRYIPEISSKNAISRNFGERIAMNTPIQGSAADVIKIAMVKVYQELKNRKLKSKMILQVHDELIIEACKDELEIVKEILKNGMEKAIELRVPLLVDVNEGNSWYDAK